MLAIIIPFYKLTFYEDTLRSLANQTDKRFKVYIGDDASPESPLQLLEQYKGKFEFVYHRFKENLGGKSLVKQWERCIALSQDEPWLMILGDDDYLAETVVSSWYGSYNRFYRKTEVIRFASKIIIQKKNEISEKYEHPVWEKATDSYLRKFNYLTRSSLSEYIFSRKTYNKYHFFDYPLAWNSDDQAWLDFSNNKPIFTINESTVYVRLSTINISGKYDNIVIKQQSQLLFYKYLISNKIKFFNTKQRVVFLRRYENFILKSRKLYISEWLYLLYYYTRYFEINDYKKLIRRFLSLMFRRDRR